MGTVLDKLRDEGVAQFNASRDHCDEAIAPGKCVAVDGCELYCSTELTKAELLALAKEIEELAHALD